MDVLYRIPYPYFFSQHDSVGGHITHSLGVIGGLIDEGHEVEVLAHEGKDMFEKAGAKFIRVEGAGSGALWRQLWLRRFFSRSRYLLNRGSFDFSYTRYSASATPHLLRELRREETPSVLEINSLGGQRLWLLKGLDARVIQAASVSLVISESLKGWIRENIGSEVASKVHVVPNGVSKARFRSVKDSSPNGTFRCAFAGLIKPHYGLECLIDAARSLPGGEFSFHIFGAGPAVPELRNRSQNVDNFILEGEIPFHEVPDRLNEMDCLVYTTSPLNSFQSPTKLFEYMAIGRPIVAARTLQTEQILEGGRLGKLFEMESADSLVAALLNIRNSYTAALERAESAQRVARKQHSWRSRVQKVVHEVVKQ